MSAADDEIGAAWRIGRPSRADLPAMAALWLEGAREYGALDAEADVDTTAASIAAAVFDGPALALVARPIGAGFGDAGGRDEAFGEEAFGGAVFGALYYGALYPGRAWRPAVFVKDFYIARSRRGLGLGAAMIARLRREAAAIGSDRIELHVTPDNPRAAAFYRREGLNPAQRTVFRVDLPEPQAAEPS